MPELPEVQRVRLSLGPHLLQQEVTAVTLRRSDIVQGDESPAALLSGRRIARIERHGKQLALLSQSSSSPESSDDSPCVCVHLGMTGSLRYHAPSPGQVNALLADKHVHILWKLGDGGFMAFRDPRRFGGLWTFPTFADLQAQRWSSLGPDALTIRPAQLHTMLSRTHRPLKAALLDQSVVAGLGNIYVDEALFACRLHPLTPADTLSIDTCKTLVSGFKSILKRAIASGGSTVRNYADSNGDAGRFQMTLQVYGRGGQPCTVCGRVLITQTVIGRTTCFCQHCQRG